MTASQLARLQRRRADAVEQEFRRTSRTIAGDAQRFVDRALNREIYSKPEDRSSTGRPLWRRTNLLAHSERAQSTDPYTVTVTNTAPYAVERHEAGKPGHRKINPLRTSHWRDELVAAYQRAVPYYWRDTIIRILRRF